MQHYSSIETAAYFKTYSSIVQPATGKYLSKTSYFDNGNDKSLLSYFLKFRERILWPTISILE